MKKTTRFLLAGVGVLSAAVGLLFGQQMNRSKFDKYLNARPVGGMELSLLQTNLDLIRDMIPTENVGVATVTYDIACKCFLGSAFVSPEFMNQTLETVRSKLLMSVVSARVYLARRFPEMSESRYGLSDRDFKMRFRTLKGTSFEIVAEYVDGKIVFE